MFKGGMAGMMQKAKQMQEDMEAVQREIKSLSCEGLAASGALKVEMNGDFKVTDVSIDESLFSDKEMLEDLIIIAVNDASAGQPLSVLEAGVLSLGAVIAQGLMYYISPNAGLISNAFTDLVATNYPMLLGYGNDSGQLVVQKYTVPYQLV